MTRHNNGLQPSVRERCIKQIGLYVKKHKKMYYPCVAAVTLVVIVTAFADLFSRNRKRLLAMSLSCAFFILASSFAYPDVNLGISFDTDSVRRDIGAPIENERVVLTDDEAVLDAVYDISISIYDEVAPAADIIPAAETKASTDEVYDDNGELLGEVADADRLDISDFADGIDEHGDDIEESEVDNSADEVTFDPADWKLILINKQHPIPQGYEFKVASVSGGGKVCDERIVAPLKEMFDSAASDGVELVVCSPYRSNARQEVLFDNKVESYMEQGYNYMDSYSLASQAVTLPGSSEHEIGIALDIISSNYSSLDEGFGDTAAGQWLADNSYKYGFVVRYLKGKELVTGIEYEPWHIRYVGIAAAQIMHSEGICLEEFWDEYLYR
ncbi:M15 family metallopeptidase [Butyrivibrio sp. MC2013]|uniref:M15 family metallopeptidase n=1 Tax=Butyrivibrio sp. MC2013 TaxID=1280686 RepID=UPI00040F7259|nr:M15 family metallopeptidase [Butyrivibrio sp. MC2013]